MKLGKTLYVTERNARRDWLTKNHAKEEEIWQVYYKQGSGNLSDYVPNYHITFNLELLC